LLARRRLGMDARTVRAVDGRRARALAQGTPNANTRQGDGDMTRRVQKGGRSEIHTDAAIDAVWAVVRDVTRTGEWSHECLSVTWLGGATEARPGARFRGRNRAGVFRWGRGGEVGRVEPAPVCAYGDACARSSGPNRTSSCGERSPPGGIPTAPSGRSGSGRPAP